jgi:protein-arginine kinase
MEINSQVSTTLQVTLDIPVSIKQVGSQFEASISSLTPTSSLGSTESEALSGIQLLASQVIREKLTAKFDNGFLVSNPDSIHYR